MRSVFPIWSNEVRDLETVQLAEPSIDMHDHLTQHDSWDDEYFWISVQIDELILIHIIQALNQDAMLT